MKSAMGQFATKLDRPRHVRFPPVSDRTADIAGGPFRAILRHQVVRCRKLSIGRWRIEKTDCHRLLNAFLTRSTALGPSGSDGDNSENFLKSANARCRSFFRAHDAPRL